MTLTELENEVLRLDPTSRARLAERLLGSLDALSKAEIEGLWLDEAERREREWDAGAVEGIPAGQVLRELRSRQG
jgi:putative addiction module component (TIGR02574 family)